MKDKTSVLIQAEKRISALAVTFLKGQDIVAVFNLIEIVGGLTKAQNQRPDSPTESPSQPMNFPPRPRHFSNN